MSKRPLLTTESETVCVLYGLSDGHIVHTHFVITLHGGQTVTEQDIEIRAKERAKQAGHSLEGLGTLQVAAQHYERGAAYRVDVARKELVKLEPNGSCTKQWDPKVHWRKDPL